MRRRPDRRSSASRYSRPSSASRRTGRTRCATRSTEIRGHPAEGDDGAEKGQRMDRIGFVGLGTMGAAMAANIRRAGFPLTVWNRTPGRAGDLVAQGATEAKTPRELAGRVDIVVTCVSDTSDVEDVLFGGDGIARGARAGTLVIDCSTISPSATRGFGER